MKNLGILGWGCAFLMTACQSTTVNGNFKCDNVNVLTGDDYLGSTYNVVVGTDFETHVRDAMLYSRAVAPNAEPEELTLVSENGSPDANSFSNGDFTFTLSDDGSSGNLSLQGGKTVLTCKPVLVGGAVTGHN